MSSPDLKSPRTLAAILGFIAIVWLLYFLIGEEATRGLCSRLSAGPFGIPNADLQQNGMRYYQNLIFCALILATILTMTLLIIKRIGGSLPALLNSQKTAAYGEPATGYLLQFAVLAACSWACFYCMINQGSEGSWYVIRDLLNFQGNSPFQQRILFLIPAKIIKSLIPALAYKHAFYLSQIVPIMLSFYFIRKWSSLFVPRLYSYLAPILLLAMLVPTIYYYNFYDFGIVMFFTLVLYLLFKKNLAWYYIVFGLGVLNHEVMLFAVFMYAAIFWKSDHRKKSFWISIAIQLCIFIGLRITVYEIFPPQQMFESGRFWTNVEMIFKHPQGLVNTGITLAAWYFLAILGLKHAPDTLRRCFYLFPMFFAIMFLFGKLNEVRLFNPFIPIVIALIMLLIRSRAGRAFAES